MTTQSIHDWIIEVGWSNKEVKKGVKDLHNTLNKIDKMHAKASGGEVTRAKKVTNELKKQNALESRRLQLRKKANEAEGLGLGGDARRARGELFVKNQDWLRARTLDLENKITEQKHQQAMLDKQATRSRKDNLRMAREAAFGASVYGVQTRVKDFGDRFAGMQMGEREQATIKARIDAIKASLAEVKSPAELNKLRADLVSVARAAQRFERAQKNVNKEMNAMKFASNGITSSLKNMARSYLSVFAAVAGVVSVVNEMKQLDTIKATFLAASGSAKQAAIDFNYVRDVAVGLGTDLGAAAKGWSQIALAGKAANMSLEETKNIFEAAQEASIAFGLSMDDQQGVLRAFSQVLSKGKLQAEEIRGQLSDRMPAAMNILANSLGVTVQELDGMMKRGELIASEVMPKFARELRKAAREGGALAAGMNTVTAAQSRMSTAWTLAINDMMDAGGKQGVVDIFDSLTVVIKDLTPVFKAFGTGLKYLGVVFKTIIIPISRTLGVAFSAVGSIIQTIDSDVSRFAKNLKDTFGWLIPHLDRLAVLHELFNKEGNYLDSAADLAFGTERGKYLEKEYYNKMAGRGYKSVIDGSTPKVKGNNTVNINVTANGTDPEGVVRKIDESYQGWLRALSTGAN